MKQDRFSDALLAPSEAAGTRLGHALLWQPTYVRDEKILWHVPFLFWLLEATRPRHYVEVGVGEGVAYMAVCQAVHRMRAHAQCTAVGDWKQDDGSIAVPERLAARNADLYDDFSTITGEGFEKAAGSIADESVDLMLIDLTQTSEAAASFHKCWLPKLAKSGILLLNGVDRGDESTAVLVASLSEKSPTIHMPGGDGLLVVLPGRDLDEELAGIAALSPDDPAHKLIVQMFTRLGAGTYYETHVRDEEQQARALDEQVRALTDERDALAARLRELQSQYDSRHRKVAILQSRHFDLQLAVAAAESKSETLASDLAAARTELDAARANAEERLGKAAAEAEVLKGKVAELSRLYSEEARHHRRLSEELSASQARLEELSAELRSEQSARADAQTARDEALKRSEEEKEARIAEKGERDSAAAEAESLRAQVTELTLRGDKACWAMKTLVEALEQSENLVTALTEEVRSLKRQVEAQALAAESAASAAAPGGWFNRRPGRRPK